MAGFGQSGALNDPATSTPAISHRIQNRASMRMNFCALSMCLTFNRTTSPARFHEPCDVAPSNRDAFARQLPPNFAYPIDAEVLLENPPDVDRQLGVPLRPFRQAVRIGFPAGVFVPG
jgi:hypothetical protein